MRIKYNKSVEGKNAWLDVNSLEDSPSLPLLLQLLQVQLVLPYSTGDQALLAMAAALYENNIMLLPTVEPGTVQVRYDATAAASLFADAPSGEVGIVWIEASKLDSPQSLSLDTPEATHYPLRLQDDNMSFKGLPYRHYMDNSMEVSDKTVLYYCRCYFRASSTAEPLYDMVYSFSVQGLADNAYVYDRRYAADPFVLYPWLSDKFREEHGIGPIGYIAVEDTYTSRETADGANIIDGALATLKTVQGATVATKNLIPFPYADGASLTSNGVTFTANSDGSITVNGTPTGYVSYRFILDFRGVGKFILSGIPSSVNLSYIVTFYNAQNDSIGSIGGQVGQIIQFDTADYTGYDHASLSLRRHETNIAINNVTVYPMLNEGSSALPYMPYFSGLKNAYFKGLQSTGRNLIPFPYPDDTKTISGVTFTVNDDGSVTANGTATSQIDFFFVSSSNQILAFPIGTVLSLSGCPSGGSPGTFFLNLLSDDYTEGITDIGNGGTVTTTKKAYYLYFQVTEGVTLTNAIIRPMLNYGSSALPYEPYISHELSLPEPVELAEWDTLDFVNNQKNVRSETLVFNGTESNWYLTSQIAEGVISIAKSLSVNGTNSYRVISTINVGLPATGSNEGMVLSNSNFSAILVWFRQSAYPNVTDLASAKAQLAAWNTAGDPLTVCYQTATATESDIDIPENRLPAYKNGSETVIQGDTDNSEYGAENTLTQEYYNLEVNGNE